MIHNMRRHDQPASRTVLESSDSTDDIDHTGRHLPPPPLSPLTPPPSTHLPTHDNTVSFGTPPTSSRKKPHPRRKRRSTDRTSPDKDIQPLATHTHQPLDSKTNLPLVPRTLGAQFSPRDQTNTVKMVPTGLNLEGTNHTDGARRSIEGGSKSDDSLEPPITPGGTLSPAVDELLRSLQQKASPSPSSTRDRTHRRTGSGGSANLLPQGRRSSSTTSTPGSGRHSGVLEMAGVRRTSSPSLSPSHWIRSNKQHQQHHQQQQTTPLLREHREKMMSSVPYSKLDSSDSNSDTETYREQDNSSYSGTSSVLNSGVLKTHRESQLLSSTHACGGQSTTTPTNHHQLPIIHLLPAPKTTLQPPPVYSPALSNESSCDITGTDGHDADSESDCGETESATEDHYPTTTATTNTETISHSFSLSLSPTFSSSVTPHPPSTSSDHYNTSPLSSSSLGSPVPPNLPSSVPLKFPSSSSPAGTPRLLSPPPLTLTDDREPDFTIITAMEEEGEIDTRSPRDEPTCTTSEEDVCESSITSQGQVAMLISQFEVGLNESMTASGKERDYTEAPVCEPVSSAEVEPESPRLEIPLHIRRKQQQHHQNLTRGSYSPVKVEQALSLLQDSGLGNSTTIVRHFFENIVSKGPPEEVGMNRTYNTTTELEDSGFQVTPATYTLKPPNEGHYGAN